MTDLCIPWPAGGSETESRNGVSANRGWENDSAVSTGLHPTVLKSRIEREEELEFSKAAGTNSHGFRYKPHKLFYMTEREVDDLNEEILSRLVASNPENPGRGADLVSDVLYLGRMLLGRRAGMRLG